MSLRERLSKLRGGSALPSSSSQPLSQLASFSEPPRQEQANIQEPPRSLHDHVSAPSQQQTDSLQSPPIPQSEADIDMMLEWAFRPSMKHTSTVPLAVTPSSSFSPPHLDSQSPGLSTRHFPSQKTITPPPPPPQTTHSLQHQLQGTIIQQSQDPLGSTSVSHQIQHAGAASIALPIATPPIITTFDEDTNDYVIRMDDTGDDVAADLRDEDCHLILTVPGSIAQYLREYQQQGIRFLLRAYAQGSGAILADDMGLGKTLQAVATIAAILGKTGQPSVDAYTPALQRLNVVKPAPKSPIKPSSASRRSSMCQASTLTELASSKKKKGTTPEEPYNIADDPRYEPSYTGTGAPILIICPTSLLDNWERELSMWGTFRVVRLHDSTKDIALMKIMGGQAEVALVTYSTMRYSGPSSSVAVKGVGPHGGERLVLLDDSKDGFGDAMSFSERILSVPWHCVIVDEAHTLKNPRTATYAMINRIPTRLRFCLTGTPMQNDYEELFNLLHFVAPGAFRNYAKFKRVIELPLKLGMKADATMEQLGDTAFYELRRLLEPYLLRRNKKIIAHQLPTKKEHVVFFDLSPQQRAAYNRLLSLPDVKLILKAWEGCPCGSGKKRWTCSEKDCPGYWYTTEANGGVLYPRYHYCTCSDVFHPIKNPDGCKNHRPQGCLRVNMVDSKFAGKRRNCPFCIVMPLIHILRKVAAHLDLIKANPDDLQKGKIMKHQWDIKLAKAVLDEDADSLGGVIQDQNYLRLSDVSSCGKLVALKALLKEWHEDRRGAGNRQHKALIFSTSVQMLKIIRRMVINAGYEHLYMDGQTPQPERQPMVDRFNSEHSSVFLFLISTLTGGVGLNLVGANKVVICDPSWNPASDLQAMDRAFRIGQSRDVSVYRLIAAGTIEEMQYLRQVSKQQHCHVAVEGSRAERRLFTAAKDVDKGELWGILNLLKYEVDRIQQSVNGAADFGSYIQTSIEPVSGEDGYVIESGQGFRVESIDPSIIESFMREGETQQQYKEERKHGHRKKSTYLLDSDDDDKIDDEIDDKDILHELDELLDDDDDEYHGFGGGRRDSMMTDEDVQPSQRKRKKEVDELHAKKRKKHPQDTDVLGRQELCAGILRHEDFFKVSEAELELRREADRQVVKKRKEAADAVATACRLRAVQQQQQQQASMVQARTLALARGAVAPPATTTTTNTTNTNNAQTGTGSIVAASSMLSSLAAWQGISLADAARQLLGMSADQRMQLRMAYCDDEQKGRLIGRPFPS